MARPVSPRTNSYSESMPLPELRAKPCAKLSSGIARSSIKAGLAHGPEPLRIVTARLMVKFESMLPLEIRASAKPF